MSDKELIKQEVERLKMEYDKESVFRTVRGDTAREVFGKLLSFIDSLEEHTDETIKENYNERYKRIAQTEQFKESYCDKSLGKEEPANELMVGDWVQFTSEQWLTEEDACPIKVTCVGEPKYPDFYPYIRIEGRNEDYHIDLFQPIPLTTEILEKNGWKSYSHEKTPIYGLIQGFEIVLAWMDYYWQLCVDGTIYRKIKIRYVHELRHALKLCGVEKTIEL